MPVEFREEEAGVYCGLSDATNHGLMLVGPFTNKSAAEEYIKTKTENTRLYIVGIRNLGEAIFVITSRVIEEEKNSLVRK